MAKELIAVVEGKEINDSVIKDLAKQIQEAATKNDKK